MKEQDAINHAKYEKSGGRIFDAVYGYIELNTAEFELVNSPIFQRLHWIKQLGPLHTVFPSAQHSRFSHTLGVFYIVKKMIAHLSDRFEKDGSGYKFNDNDKEAEVLRFAALLHDIGHVPLSHVGEEVLKNAAQEEIKAKQKSVNSRGAINVFKYQEPSWWILFPEKEYRGDHTKLHERLSAEIVLHNEEIDKALNMVWPDPKQREEAKKKMAQIIVGKDETNVPTLLLHSELDADRIDYLLRDSFFTGVGYGKIELDYIISRLCIHRGKDGVAILCVEDKGLHTIEHYILGRFFLQTQVIFNRKVRLMDLLFADVMEYMVKAGEKRDWGVMKLQQVRYHIRSGKGKNKRDHLHAIYKYTDAEVFGKMRQLHEQLDYGEKKRKAATEERYINDCIKIIMDGRIDNPVITDQKIIDLKRRPDYKKTLEEEANKIKTKVAKKNKIFHKRINVNIVEQEVMKYRKRREAKDDKLQEVNREAVKIRDKTGNDQYKWMFAAESNATILRGLHDKALLILNIYYIPSKTNAGAEEYRKKVEESIKQGFDEFVTKHFKGK